MPVITLTQSQITQCETVAKNRVAVGGEVYFNQDRMTPEYSYQIDVLGAKSELAVSLFLGLPWTGQHGAGLSDVSGFEVRSTQRKDGKQYWLYVRKQDKDAIYIYCVVDDDKIVICGWASAWQVRNNGVLLYKDNDCYGLRREELHPMWQLDEVTEFAGRPA
jgi:hypothetical protein